MLLEPIAWPDDSPALELAVLNRVGWGANHSSYADIARLGTGRWLDAQLHPAPARLPAEPQAAINAMTISQRPVADIAAELERQRRAFQNAGAEERKAERQAYQESLGRLGREAQTRMLLRALYSPNQLEEQMTWFWMNHFSVFQFKGPLRALLADYEERAVRPQALGRFRDLLGATARHPAMLIYLDNARNSAGRINENYARELMELHTLGVDGGYTQKDVTEVARAFTGWTIDRPRDAARFVFRPLVHDRGEKTILGLRISAGGGQDDGERVLSLLLHHPATARFIATKLVRRFVSDEPPPALVERVAATFRATEGDIKAMLRALVTSPEFWAPEARRAKIKKPFEYVASAVRAVGGHVDARAGFALARYAAEMGEGLYGAQPPTGYPDRAEAWVNAGALLARMNFALALTQGRLPGVTLDVSALAVDRGAPDAALERLLVALLHGEASAPTRAVLTAQLTNPEIRRQTPDDRGPADTDVEKLAALVIGSPEFQRR